MTCATCPPECPFRWREWTGPSFAMAFQAGAKSQATSTQRIEDERAKGVDKSYMPGIGQSSPVRDPKQFLVRRTERVQEGHA